MGRGVNLGAAVGCLGCGGKTGDKKRSPVPQRGRQATKNERLSHSGEDRRQKTIACPTKDGGLLPCASVGGALQIIAASRLAEELAAVDDDSAAREHGAR